MIQKTMMTASDVADELGISKAYAYKIIKKLNAELTTKGYRIIPGKTSRKYFSEQFYGVADCSKGA